MLATVGAVLAARNDDAEILGVLDLTNRTEAKLGAIRLGNAIQFVANASVLDMTSAQRWFSMANRERQA